MRSLDELLRLPRVGREELRELARWLPGVEVVESGEMTLSGKVKRIKRGREARYRSVTLDVGVGVTMTFTGYCRRRGPRSWRPSCRYWDVEDEAETTIQPYHVQRLTERTYRLHAKGGGILGPPARALELVDCVAARCPKKHRPCRGWYLRICDDCMHTGFPRRIVTRVELHTSLYLLFGGATTWTLDERASEIIIDVPHTYNLMERLAVLERLRRGRMPIHFGLVVRYSPPVKLDYIEFNLHEYVSPPQTPGFRTEQV